MVRAVCLTLIQGLNVKFQQVIFVFHAVDGEEIYTPTAHINQNLIQVTVYEN